MQVGYERSTNCVGGCPPQEGKVYRWTDGAGPHPVRGARCPCRLEVNANTVAPLTGCGTAPATRSIHLHLLTEVQETASQIVQTPAPKCVGGITHPRSGWLPS